MKKIRTLLVVFENEISAGLISSFRGAVISRVGFDNKTFHNHEGDKYIYKYPAIQYKVVGKKAALYCVGEGVDEIHNFFGLSNWDIIVQGRKLDLKIDRLDLNSFNFNVWDKMFSYQIRNWLALNTENYKKYQQLEGLAERIQMLEKTLTGNILSFAKGIDWHIEKPVKVQIQELIMEKKMHYKGVPLMAFDVDFRTNVFLPNFLGLGKSASHGFGVVYNKSIKQQNN